MVSQARARRRTNGTACDAPFAEIRPWVHRSTWQTPGSISGVRGPKSSPSLACPGRPSLWRPTRRQSRGCPRAFQIRTRTGAGPALSRRPSLVTLASASFAMGPSLDSTRRTRAGAPRTVSRAARGIRHCHAGEEPRRADGGPRRGRLGRPKLPGQPEGPDAARVTAGLRGDTRLSVSVRRISLRGFYTWTLLRRRHFRFEAGIQWAPELDLRWCCCTQPQRRADVVELGRQHMREGCCHLRHHKTGTTLSIPVHPGFRAVFEATPVENMTFLITHGRASHPGRVLRMVQAHVHEAGYPPERPPMALGRRPVGVWQSSGAPLTLSPRSADIALLRGSTIYGRGRPSELARQGSRP